MATDVAALSTYSNVTREAHRRRVAFAGNKALWMWDKFKADPQKHAGESLVNFSLKYQMGEGASYTAEGAAHPSASQSAHAKGQLYIKKLISIMKYNEEIVQLKGPEVIIDKLVDIRMDCTDTYKLLREHSLHTPGNGVLATCTVAAGGSQYFTVDSTRWLRVGMTIDGYDSENHHDADSVVITNINPSTKVVTVTGTVSSVDTGTSFYYNDTYTASGGTIATTKYTNGIETICSDTDPAYGDFEGLDRDTYDYAKATVAYGSVPGTAEAFTQDRLFDLFELAHGIVGPDNLPDWAYGSLKCYRAVYNAYRDEQQPTIFMPAKDGMPSGLQFQYGSHMVRIVPSHLAAPNTLYMPNMKYCIKYSGGVEGWDNYAGSVSDKVPGYQQFQEIYRGWWNYGTDFPQSNLALFDITEA